MVELCKCCGHPLQDFEVQLGLTRMQRAMYQALQKAGNAGLTRDQLIDKIYGQDSNGGPETAENSLYVQRNKMRANLAKFGLKITTSKGHGSIWRLEK